MSIHRRWIGDGSLVLVSMCVCVCVSACGLYGWRIEVGVSSGMPTSPYGSGAYAGSTSACVKTRTTPFFSVVCGEYSSRKHQSRLGAFVLVEDSYVETLELIFDPLFETISC